MKWMLNMTFQRKILKWIFDLKHQNFEFSTSKGNMFEQFNNSEWTNKFSYFTDITLHMNDSNLCL